MYLNYVWFILICYSHSILTDDASEKACLSQEYPDIRKFYNLSDFKENNISFNSKSSDFRGHNVAFEAKEIQIVSISSFDAYTSENVIQLNLSHKSIEYVQPRAFITMRCLKYLDLSHNKLINVTRQNFFDLVSLTTLDLSWNKIRILFHFTFKYAPNLIVLDVSHNNIVRMEDLAFYYLTKLERLILAHNRYMKKFYYYYIFDNLVDLKFLDLSYCSIGLFNVDVFRSCQQLQILDLAGNDLVVLTLNEGSNPYNKFVFMNLSDNSLMKIDIYDMKRLFPNDRLRVDINDNSFYCSELETVLDRLSENNISVTPGKSFDAEQQRNAIICDTVNATHHYTGPLDTTTTPKPTTPISIAILNTYHSEVKRHRVIVGLLSAIICLAVAYDVFIMVDYFMELGITKKLFRKHLPRVPELDNRPELEPFDP